MWSLIKRISLRILSFITILFIVGGVFQFISSKIDENAYPIPGKLVDIGGYRLHINSSGKGGPTVILEAGMACSSIDWALVQPEIAKFTRVCSYDRAGYGWSDESPLDRTSENIVEELHVLLENAKEKGPYILVGHSFGGSNVRLYASKYPNDVLGVILVDSAHENQMEEIPELPLNFLERLLTHPRIAPFLASVGLVRIFNHLSLFQEKIKMLPIEIQEIYLAKICKREYISAATQEFDKLPLSLKQLKNAGGFLGDRPLIIIKAGNPLTPEKTGYPKEFTDKLAIVWEIFQEDLVNKSTRAKRMIAENSGHMIPHDHPMIIIESVKTVIDEIQ